MMEDVANSGIFGFLLAIILVFVIVAVFRNLGAWIFKINEVLENQEHILKELKSLREKLDK